MENKKEDFMSRSINESITALTNARNDIVDALNSKIEGGGDT